MGKIDTAGRQYFSDCERFAELINAALYHGEQVLCPENLVLLKRKYPSLSSSYGEKERDVIMHDKAVDICYGIEIETESDYSMPERVITYDVCEYEWQIREIHKRHKKQKDYKTYRENKSRMKEDEFLLPVITVVLYLGEGHWEGRRKMSQMFRLSEKAKKRLSNHFFNYHSILLVEADYIDPEDYRTDLKEFFEMMQCRQSREHMEELLQTERFQNLPAETEQAIMVHLHMEGLIEKVEKGGVSMCKAIRDWLKEERQAGWNEGQKTGRREEKISIIRRMLKEGMDEFQIIRVTGCTKAELAEAGR